MQMLSKLVGADVAVSIVKGQPLAIPRIQSRRIEFVFVLIRADSPEQLSKRIGLVTDAGLKHGAVVHSVIGPMVVMAFGTLRWAQPADTSRTNLVNYMQERFGNDIRIAHGAADGHFGNFGGGKSIHLTFSFPRFEAVLAALGRLEFGQTEELP